jgi:conjugative relaxase-like TrwC/TraI family protein
VISIGKITSGPAAAAYYIDQVANGRDDYYAGKREEPGRWIGAGAAALGWSGVVDADEFGRLLVGAGVRQIGEGGVAGFDLTFRAPKSVSVLWAIGDGELAGVLRAAHDEAVAGALGFFGARGGVGASRRRRPDPDPGVGVRRGGVHASRIQGG